MALVPGVIAFVGGQTSAVVMAPLPGRSGGMEVPEFDHFTGIEVPGAFVSVEGAVQNGNAPGIGDHAGNLVPAQVADRTDLGTAMDWFEKIHIFPGDTASNPRREENHEVAFGNILAQIDEEYEIYNAHRHADTTLTAVVNNAEPGVETPDVSAPLDVTAQTSILDPTSTFNTDLTTGLGTKVRTVVRALVDGLPNFDTTIDFSFSPGNLVVLPVSGDRIVMFTSEFELPVEEVMSFLTDIIPTRAGKEQRISVRKQPRESWRVPFHLIGEDRQRFLATLMDWQDNAFGLPLWHEAVPLTAATSGGATVFPVSGASKVDFRVGGLAVAFTDAGTFDVLTLTAVTDTQLTSGSPAANAYPAGTRILPVRVTRISRIPSGRRHPVNLEEVQVEFQATDNDTGAPAGGTTWNPNTYNGRVLLDECNVVEQTVGEQFDRRVVVIDNATGVVQQSSPWDKNKRAHVKGFMARNRQGVKDLKAILRHLRGRQKAFYIPTFADDLTVVANIGMGTTTLDIANIGYVRFVKDRNPKKIFRITFTDGTSLVRSVQSSIVVSPTVERLTLDTTWPANRTVAEVRRVQHYELVRFDTDDFALRYDRVGQASLFAPVLALFDDD